MKSILISARYSPPPIERFIAGRHWVANRVEPSPHRAEQFAVAI
jgi:hypothetical protein